MPRQDAGARPGTPTRRRGRPPVDDKRRRVLDAALRVFAARGYHGTAVPEVAKAAGVGTGTLYHYFEHKQELVNEVYRDAKLRLRAALLEGLAEPDLRARGAGRAWFLEVWQRLAAFATREPDAFRFLEMQDHVEYLDAESRRLELSVVAPLFAVAQRLRGRLRGRSRGRRRERTAEARTDVVIALAWGAFVGLVKLGRLGYLRLDDAALAAAGEACWRMVAPEAGGAAPRRSAR